jgi:hypothetical protein
MATSILPSGTSERRPVSIRATISRHAERLKEIIRQARSRTTRKQHDEYVRNAAKSVLSSEKCRAVEIVCALVVDIAQRADLAEAEAIGQHLIAIARSEHAACHPVGVQLSRA